MTKQVKLQLPLLCGSYSFLLVSAGGLDSEADGAKTDIVMSVSNKENSQ